MQKTNRSYFFQDSTGIIKDMQDLGKMFYNKYLSILSSNKVPFPGMESHGTIFIHAWKRMENLVDMVPCIELHENEPIILFHTLIWIPIVIEITSRLSSS